jgi:hypothetical protein
MGEYKVRFKITTPPEYLDGKKIPNAGTTTLQTVNASSKSEAITEAKKNYKASNHYKNIMKNQDFDSPKKPRVRVMKVYGGGGSSSEQFLGDPTDMSENLDSNKGMKKGGLVKKRGWGIAKSPRKK